MARFPVTSSSARWLPVFQSFLLIGAAWFSYAPALRGGWLWDDDLEITNNRLVQDPAALAKIWVGSGERDYLPLKATVNWLQWRLWGANPLGYHLTSVALHVLGAFLFWRLLRRVGAPAAWWGALLFVVHPMAVESVAWVSELKNTLSLPLMLLAMIGYVEFDERRSRGAYLGSLLSFLAAMLCKTSVAMFPVVLLLYAWWRRGRIARRELAASAPFFAISLALGAVGIWFQSHRTDLVGAVGRGGILTHALDGGSALGFYFCKSLWPAKLMPIYPRWPAAWGLLAWALLAGLAAWLGTRRTPWSRTALFGLGYFAVSLVPVLGFIPMSFLRLAPVSDHLAYVALLGMAGLAAAAGGALWQRLPARRRRWALAGAAALCALLAVTSRSYAKIFWDELGFWSYAERLNPHSWAAPTNLAIALDAAGRKPEALAQYEQALRLNPDEPTTHYNVATALRDAGRLPEAAEQYRQALGLDPKLLAAQSSLGVALTALGEWPEAIVHLRAALQRMPGDAVIEFDLGNALAGDGQLPEAIDHYEAALRPDPAQAEAQNNLANALHRAGRTEEAIAHYEEAARLRPDLAIVHFNLAVSLSEVGRRPEAIAEYEATLRLQPDFPGAREGLGEARQSR